MGKQGPCRHCGVTSTPLWRNGPPEKPILCNACGSRWRTKGTLVNYTPLHARAEPDEFEDYRVSRVKSISIKNKEAKVLKRKHQHENEVVGGFTPDYNQGYRKVLDEDTSNRSSSGSAISNSESCVQLGSADASELTGPAQSIVWDTMVPSRKRTCVSRSKPSSVEKLTKDLRTILDEQQSQFSGSSEEDLLFESDTPMVSVEIGHGGVLIRHPSSIAREEESEASSLSVDNNKRHPINEAYSRLTTLHVHNNKGVKFPSPGIEKNKKLIGQGFEQEHINRDKAQHELLQILGNRNSPLCNIDLQDVLNFEEFMNHTTNDEQHQLLKYLPSNKDGSPVDSFENMFDSPQFKENLSSFQKLLSEGVFDLSLSAVKSDGSKTLKRLALCNFTKFKWVEQYNLLKDVKGKSITGGSIVGQGLNGFGSGHSVNVKRSRDGQGQYQNFPGAKTTMKSPKRASMKTSYENKELIENDDTCFSLFSLPPDSSSLMLDSFQFANDNSDQDLLLDVPSHSSFPQAELLFPSSSFGASAQASTSSSSIYQNLVHP